MISPPERKIILGTLQRRYSKPSAPVDVTYKVSEDQLDISLFPLLAKWYKEKYLHAEDAWLLLQEYVQENHYTMTIYDDYIKDGLTRQGSL